MNIAIYGKSFNDDFDESIRRLFSRLSDYKAHVFIYEPFTRYLSESKKISPNIAGTYNSYESLPEGIDYLLSIGGDGTFLETVSVVRDKDIPIIGFNTGRLGFLSSIKHDEINESLDALFRGESTIEQRSLIEVDSGRKLFRHFSYAFNEVTIQKTRTSMINVQAWVNGEYLNTYWADGLIVSTPTGSTAYSLSVGGPIMSPDAGTFIILPLAPHNLGVRPIIISDRSEVRLKANSRENSLSTSVDYMYEVHKGDLELVLRKAPFTIKLVRLGDHSFFSALRNKLMWGADKRN